MIWCNNYTIWILYNVLNINLCDDNKDKYPEIFYDNERNVSFSNGKNLLD